MIHICDSCSSRFKFEDSFLKPGPNRFKCPHCAHVSEIIGQENPQRDITGAPEAGKANGSIKKQLKSIYDGALIRYEALLEKAGETRKKAQEAEENRQPLLKKAADELEQTMLELREEFDARMEGVEKYVNAIRKKPAPTEKQLEDIEAFETLFYHTGRVIADFQGEMNGIIKEFRRN